MRALQRLSAFPAAVCGLLAACASVPPQPATPVAAVASGRFCASAQQRMASTHLEVENIVHRDYDQFVKSKPVVKPLQTEEFHWFEDDTGTRVKMVSCKMKTVDHLRAEYGPQSAGDEGTCSGLNAQTLQSVIARLDRRDRARLRFDRARAVVFDADLVTNSGPVWLAPFPMATVAPDGALHILSKGMRNDFNDPRTRDAPLRFRGTRYCHLIAPEYLERILLGDVTPPASE